MIWNKGYCFKKLEFDKGIFDNSIDCSYVIFLLGNNERYDSINIELKKIKTTKNLFILMNKGYTSGEKSDYIKTARQDINDCYWTIFKHAKNKR